MVALASAFVRLRPEVNKQEWSKSGEEAGAAGGAGAGKGFGEGYKRDVNGRLRDVNGKFVKDAEAAGKSAGGKAGSGFGASFSKGSTKAFGAIKENLKLAAGVFVPLGIAGAVGEIAKIGIAYEDNLNILKTVTGATGKQMDQVAAKARQLGAAVDLPGVSAAGAADAMTELAKAGFTVQQSMDAAKGTLQLARIASIDEADAAEIAANAVNAFGIKASDTSFVVDELAAAANSSSIEVTEASAAFKQAAAVFSGLQGPAVGGKEAITELNTAIAILGNNGIKGSDAGTSLKQMFLQLTAPATKTKNLMHALNLEAHGANISLDDQRTILNGSTKQVDEVINSLDKANPKMKNFGDIAYDSAGQMRSLPEILILLQTATKNWSQEERNAAITQIFGADATRSVLALLKGGPKVYDAQRQAVLKSGAAAEFAAAKNAGLGGALDNVKSQFENAAIAIYNVVKGPLTTALTGLAGQLPVIFGYIAQFSKFIYDNIDVLRDWAVAIGAVTLALKINSAMLAVQAAGSIFKAIQGISIIAKATATWTAAQELLNITLVANPIGALIVLLVALAAGIVLLYRHNETFRKIVQATWAAIKAAVAASVDWILHTAWPALVTAWNAIGTAVMWLYQNAILPAWHGIQAAIGVAVGLVQKYIAFLIFQFNIVKTVVMFLWQHVFGPAFAAISKIVQIWWLSVEILFKAFYNVIRNVVVSGILFFRDVAKVVFGFIVNGVIVPWWNTIKTLFGLFRQYILGPVIGALRTLLVGVTEIFRAVAIVVRNWYNNNIKPIFSAVRSAWNTLAVGFREIFNGTIKPLFLQFIDFFTKKVVGSFHTGVAAIKTAWAAIKEAARAPVAFVVNHVINPFINGLNSAAKIVGVKDRVAPIAGFAQGGKISGAGGTTDNRQAWIPGRGAVQLQGGEFIVNRQDTAQALPLLRWINTGMKGGPDKADRWLGRPVTDMPGDGSEGFAFKKGGLIGWVDDVWNSISHPLDTIKKPFEVALGRIPGSGMIKDFLIGSGKKLLNGSVSWLTKFAGGGGDLGKATQFLRAQNGKPYGWASAGPDSYDCSGIVDAVYNIMHGRSPYSHTFSTSNAQDYFPKPGQGGPLVAAWSHPGQNPASNSVGHMMGRLGALTFESTGSRGVHLGTSTRSLNDFANIGHYRRGGLFDQPVQLFDQGGMWPTGTLGANLSGHTEYVNPGGRAGGGNTYTINVNVPVGAHPAEVGRQTVSAIQSYEQANGKGWRS